MPYYFTFKVNNRIKFQAPLITKQCISTSQNGERCRHKCVIGSPYCWIHLLYKKHLRIKPSTIPNAGVGLFALNPKLPSNAIIFRRGDEIIGYNGQIISNRERKRRYGNKTAPYGIQLNERETEDGALERGVGTIINHTNRRNPACNANLELDEDEDEQHRCVIIATKAIRNGQEILTDYGNEYILNEVGVEYKTAYKS